MMTFVVRGLIRKQRQFTQKKGVVLSAVLAQRIITQPVEITQRE